MVEPDPNIPLGFQIDWLALDNAMNGIGDPDKLDPLTGSEYDAFLDAIKIKSRQSKTTKLMEASFDEYREAQDAIASEMQGMTPDQVDAYIIQLDELREAKAGRTFVNRVIKP